MCATVQEIMNGNQLWNDGMTKGNTICPRPFHGGGIKRKNNPDTRQFYHTCIFWIFFLQSMGDKLEFGMMYRTKFLFHCISSSDSLCRLVIVIYILYSSLRYKDARNIWGSAHVHIKLIRYQFLCIYLELLYLYWFFLI
jgi:hypothetical protein